MIEVITGSVKRISVRAVTALAFLLLLTGPVTGCSPEQETETEIELEAAFSNGNGAFSESSKGSLTGRSGSDDSGYEGRFGNTQSGKRYVEPVSFIEGDFYGKKIRDEDDALDAVYSVIEELGGDDETVIELVNIRPTEDDIYYYTFRQLEADTTVYGSSLKLVVGADGYISALISSLVPGIDALEMSEWAITEEEAEEIVLSENSDLNLAIVEGASEQTLLPFMDDSEEFYYAWVVYTNNVYDEFDTAYLAHYVDEEGEYLYALPVTAPGSADALSGEGAYLAFTGFKEGTLDVTVEKSDGTKENITVPTLIDKETGDVYLGDLDRKILVADYFSFVEDDEIDIRKKGKKGFADNELLIYDTFIRIYDTYSEMGWDGPDGDGSPTLLLMDWVDENGDVVNNACYAGRQYGFEVFQFNREDPDGENTDVMAHEFTHCLTTTLMLNNLYYNDYGAINESFSDICGNLIEAMLEDTEDTTWLVGEHEQNGAYRSMSDPHLFEQPAFSWDIYYVPHPETVSENNDNGGVHINSSLLNLIAYRLNESGMDYSDQLYYWMNVALALTPRTDYEDLSKILTWCIREAGYEEYKEILEDAIEEVRIDDPSMPEKLSQDLGMVKFDFPFADPDNYHYATVLFMELNDLYEYVSWPMEDGQGIAVSLPEGDYAVIIFLENEDGSDYMDILLTEDGFVEIEDEFELYELVDEVDPVDFCHVKRGKVLELDSETLVPLLKKAERRLWR
ncbi:MAG: M4 family metallopeptidase [Lachnospiraceae bacterium]|nr:M4 family metallopeptidase [Lachnospiraceae bacterium]